MNSKRRSFSQRVGSKGEAIFREWSVDNHLIPQKVEEDFGIDFFCQEMKDVSKAIEETTGNLIGVQVRSVDGNSRPRVKLNKVDVESALRLAVPYCLVGIIVSTREVFFLFLNEILLKNFHNFLLSNNETKSFKLDGFQTGSNNFQKNLKIATSFQAQNKLKLLKAELNIKSDISGARLKIIQSSNESSAIVDVPWITQIFDIEGEKRNQLSELIFGNNSNNILNKVHFTIKPSIKSLNELTGGPILLRGKYEEVVKLFVKYKSEYHEANFFLRRLDDERAYIHKSGLVLIVSDARKDEDGIHKHWMSIKINSENSIPFNDFGSDLKFLKMLHENSTINEVGRPGISVKNWPDLHRIGPAAIAIEKVYSFFQLDLTEVFLSDIQSEEFGKTISILEMLVDKIGLEHVVPGFIIGPAAKNRPENKFWKRVMFMIPLVCNLKGLGVEIWVEGIGEVYLYGKPPYICGFRIIEQKNWKYKLHDNPFKIGINPEMWTNQSWPSIPLFKVTREEIVDFGEKSYSHPLQAKFRFLNE